MIARTSCARAVSGTRCVTPAFMRVPGTVQTTPVNSDHGASRASLGLAVVKIMNSSANRETLSCSRNRATKAGTSAYGMAG